MTSKHGATDTAILALVARLQPVGIAKLIDELDRTGHRNGLRSTRIYSDRLYELKKGGFLVVEGLGKAARWMLPDYNAPTNEAQRQAAEGQKRSAQPEMAPAVMVVEKLTPHLPPNWQGWNEQGESPPAPGYVRLHLAPDPDMPEGWRLLPKQLADEQPPSPPTAPEPIQPPIVQAAPFNLSISGLAGDVAAQVALTVERVVGQGIKRYESIIADLQQQLVAAKDEQQRLQSELAAAEQLGQEAEAKLIKARQRLADQLRDLE